MILGLDPGTTESAIIALESDGVIGMHDKLPNDGLLVRLRSYCDAVHDLLAIEDIEARGMAVGRETFETAKWIGRFAEAWQNRGGKVVLIYRRQVKIFHCGSAKAGDSNIRAAIIDRYGGQPAAIGRKAEPGPLWGIKSDRWSALAVALCAEGKLVPETFVKLPKKESSELPF